VRRTCPEIKGYILGGGELELNFGASDEVNGLISIKVMSGVALWCPQAPELGEPLSE